MTSTPSAVTPTNESGLRTSIPTLIPSPIITRRQRTASM